MRFSSDLVLFVKTHLICVNFGIFSSFFTTGNNINFKIEFTEKKPCLGNLTNSEMNQ